MNPDKRASIETILNYCFRDPSILKQALNHSSHQHPELQSNERMEFLGDAILNFIISEELFRSYPELSEGELSRIKSVVVSTKTLAEMFYQKKQYKEATKYYQKLIAAFPNDLDVLASTAWCYYAAKNSDTAKKMFIAVLAIDPNHVSSAYGYNTIAGEQAKIQAEKQAEEKTAVGKKE